MVKLLVKLRYTDCFNLIFTRLYFKALASQAEGREFESRFPLQPVNRLAFFMLSSFKYIF